MTTSRYHPASPMLDPQPRRMAAPAEASIQVDVLLCPGFAAGDLAFIVDTLAEANRILGSRRYRWSLRALSGASVPSAAGFEVSAEALSTPHWPPHAIILVAGDASAYAPSSELMRHLRVHYRHNVLLGAIGAGVVVLAATNVLDEEQLAVHPDLVDGFRERFPFQPVASAPWWIGRRCLSAVGGVSTLNLSLALVARHSSQEVADAVATRVNHAFEATACRPSAAALSTPSQRARTYNRKLKQVIQQMAHNTEEPLDLYSLADCVGLSMRQVQRLFKSHFGCTPRDFYADLRLSKARRLLEQTGLSITEVGLASGFVSASHFTARFASKYGCSPSAHRLKDPIGHTPRRGRRDRVEPEPRVPRF